MTGDQITTKGVVVVSGSVREPLSELRCMGPGGTAAVHFGVQGAAKRTLW